MSHTPPEGPKVFTFDALTCEALQPFPSVMIHLPEDYMKKRVVSLGIGTHVPEFITVHR
jgi:hypothetical protein